MKFKSANDVALITRFIRKMNGTSEPFLAEASDGKRYVVKFAQEGCANFLFNECLGSNLYGLFGLPSPPWKSLILTDEFLDLNTGCWLEKRGSKARPPAGLCFGSQFVGDYADTVFQVLPESWYKRIHHRFDFWRAWFLDVCADHYDTRQALFQQREDGRVQPWFIDHGFMFGGPDCTNHGKLIAPRYLDSRIYGRLPLRSLSTWVEAVQAVDQDAYWTLLESIPKDWKSLGAMSAFARFLSRVLDKDFASIVIEEMDAINQAFLRIRSGKPAWHVYSCGHFHPAGKEGLKSVLRGPKSLWVTDSRPECNHMDRSVE